MGKGPNGEQRPGDTVGCAVVVGKIAVGLLEESSQNQTPGRSVGGRAGGRARALALTPEQRSQIARKAAKARWSNRTR